MAAPVPNDISPSDIVVELSGVHKTFRQRQRSERLGDVVRNLFRPTIRKVQALAETFARRTRAEWEAVFEGSEVCFAPVLDLDEAPQHAHNRARRVFYETDDGPLPMPAPRFERTPAGVPRPTSEPGADTDTALEAWGFSATEIERLLGDGVVSSTTLRSLGGSSRSDP